MLADLSCNSTVLKMWDQQWVFITFYLINLEIIVIVQHFLIFYPTELDEWRRAVGGPAPNQNPGTPGEYAVAIFSSLNVFAAEIE